MQEPHEDNDRRAASRAYFASIQDENGVDLTLIRENLKLTPDQRVRKIEQWADELRRIPGNVRRVH